MFSNEGARKKEEYIKLGSQPPWKNFCIRHSKVHFPHFGLIINKRPVFNNLLLLFH